MKILRNRFKSGFIVGALLFIACASVAHLAPGASDLEKFAGMGCLAIIGLFGVMWMTIAEDTRVKNGLPASFPRGATYAALLCGVADLVIVQPILQRITDGGEKFVPIVAYLDDAVLVRACKVDEKIGPNDVHFRFVDFVRFQFKKPGEYNIHFTEKPELDFKHTTVNPDSDEELCVRVPYDQPVTVAISANGANDSHLLDRFPIVHPRE